MLIVAGRVLSGPRDRDRGGTGSLAIDFRRTLDAAMPRKPMGGRYVRARSALDCIAPIAYRAFNDGNFGAAGRNDARAGIHLRGMHPARLYHCSADAVGADYGHKVAVEQGLFRRARPVFVARAASCRRRRARRPPRAVPDTSIALRHLRRVGHRRRGWTRWRKAVRENLRQGVDQIKIMAGGGSALPPGQADPPDSIRLRKFTPSWNEAERAIFQGTA